MTAPVSLRSRVLAAAALIVVGSLGIQASSAISSTLFSSYGSVGVSGLRSAVAALILLLVIRPRLTGRGRSEWVGIGVYGAAMALMSVSLYRAIERLPLGVAVTLEFLGPCAVALLAARRVREGLCALLALGGVALISAGPAGFFDLGGYVAGLLAALFFGLYTVFAARVGKTGSGLDGLALSVTVSAILTSPFALPAAGGLTATDGGLLVLAAIVGVVIPYSVDALAGRLTSARIIGTLFAVDPAMGALVGYWMLGERLSLTALCGIVLVMGAGALLVWSSSDRPDPVRAAAGPTRNPVVEMP